MDNQALKKILIDTLQANPFSRDALITVLDENQSIDLSHDDFKQISSHSIKRNVSVYDKQLTDTTINGNINVTINDDYNLVEHVYKGKHGSLSVLSSGNYIYTVTNNAMLDLIAQSQSIVIKEDITISYTKKITIDSVSAMIAAYVAYHCDAVDMQKVLDIGCCPNHNLSDAELVSSVARDYPGPDKYSFDSRPLLNAIKRGDNAVAQTLINHNCPCCNGAGAKVTSNLVDLAPNGTDIHATLLQAQNA